jgi:hypothetical protein
MRSEQMSGITRWMVGSLTGLVVAVASLASMAGPAQAYDAATCDWRFGAGNVADVDLVWIDTGIGSLVDFGDVRNAGDQVIGKAPAVVCWATDGQVAVLGRVFADSGDTVTMATAQVTFFDDDGTALAPSSHSVVGNQAASSPMNHGAGNDTFTRARIRLYSRVWNTKLVTVVHTSNYYRG